MSMSEKEWLREFGDNLRDIMKEKNLTQRELAKMTHLAPSTISKYLNEGLMPNAKAIVNLSYALDCSFEDLIDFFDTID